MKAKRSMSSLDIKAEADELQELLGARFQKAYDPTKGSLLLRLRTPDGEKAGILAEPGRFIVNTNRDVPIPKTPGHFPSLLRKHLGNAPLTAVRQQGFDRVLVMEFGRDEPTTLILELFGRGNMVLVSGGRIKGLYRTEVWKDRVLRAGREYAFPPSRLDPRGVEKTSFSDALQAGTDIVRGLAIGLNLGGTHAEEVCRRAGIDKTLAPSEISDNDLTSLHQTLGRMLGELNDPKPGIYSSEGVRFDVQPIEMHIYEDYECEDFAAYNSALDSYFELADDAPLTTDTIIEDHATRIRKRQRESIERFLCEADEAQKMGDTIYEHYQHFADALESIASLMQESDWNHLAPELPESIRLGGKFGEIEVQTPAGGPWVRMLISEDVNANAAVYYDRAKKLKSKASGAEKAIERAGKGKPSKPKVRKRPFTKDFWFERYRWCLTTGGRTVLGGRDRKTNETLVRKHLKDGDVYVHADIHGAPSCVLKDGAGAEEEELEQACSFAVLYSKAWNAGLGSVPGYWVTPDQVSKTPQSGEYLSTGAFVIRGKRNYYHHLPMVICIGTVEIEGKLKVMGGPEKSVAERTDQYVVLEPGDTPHEKVGELTAHLACSNEEVMRVVPGNYRIIKKVG